MSTLNVGDQVNWQDRHRLSELSPGSTLLTQGGDAVQSRGDDAVDRVGYEERCLVDQMEHDFPHTWGPRPADSLSHEPWRTS